MEWLLELDQQAFLAINGSHSEFLDVLMYWISNRWVWIPVYCMGLGFLVNLYGWREALAIGVFAGLMIVLTDQVSSSLLKPWVGRLRPCHDPELFQYVHLVNGKCWGQYGFVSSHAANFFGLAVYLGHFLRPIMRKWALVLLLVAAIVGMSRVYLGVHYPGDVLGGAVLGVVFALGIVWCYGRIRPVIAPIIHRKR